MAVEVVDAQIAEVFNVCAKLVGCGRHGSIVRGKTEWLKGPKGVGGPTHRGEIAMDGTPGQLSPVD